MDIVLKNSCGCELDRVSVGDTEAAASALVRAIQTEGWVLEPGDTITFEVK